jgi:hypothetical protein
MTGTEALITELQQQSELDGTWSVTSDELSSIYDPVDFYRASYQVEQLGVDHYGPENAGEFAEIVSTVAERDYRPALREAGLYRSHDDRIELTGRFVRGVQTTLVLHTADPETFKAMLRQFRRYDEAELVYIDTYLQPERIVARCTDEYVDIRSPGSAEAALRATVETYLKLLLRRHVVEIRSLGQSLFEILQTVARAEGYLRRPRSGTERGEQTRHGGASRADSWESGDHSDPRTLRRARQVLGLEAQPENRATLQKAYRNRMRVYHPDVNPDGLEMAKQINHAYAILIAAIAE